MRMQQRERDYLAQQLRELLSLLEDPEVDISNLRRLLWPWRHDPYYREQVIHRLSRLEERIERVGNRACAFSEEAGGSGAETMHYITGLVGREREERRHITTWIAGAERLTIVDPYFFSFGGPNRIFRTQAKYIESLADLLPTSLRALEVFHLPGPNRQIFSAFQNRCQQRNIALCHWATTEVHDRVVIRGDNKAKALGTSFGGLSNKIAFVLDFNGVRQIQWVSA